MDTGLKVLLAKALTGSPIVTWRNPPGSDADLHYAGTAARARRRAQEGDRRQRDAAS